MTPRSLNPYGLTDLQLATMQHLVLGKSHREVAEVMGVSHHTVHDRVEAVYRKTDTGNLVVCCVRLIRAGYFLGLEI